METERVVLPTDVYPVHYDLEISPNLDTCEFSGELVINYDVRVATKEIHLHSKQLSMSAAKFVDANGKSQNVSTIAFNVDDTTVIFGFKEEFAIGAGKFHCTYKGILNSDMAGFYISNYTDADGVKRKMASTQFEALDARRAFPCVDEPGVKSTFGLTLIVKKDLSVLSNMPEALVNHLAGGLRKVVFDVSPKMSTYLLAWAVGEFDMIRGTTKHGVTLGVYCPPGRAEHGKFALDVGIKALDWYDDFFGVPYPLPKMDMICITEFAMGAMENWGLVTYREVDLMIDAEKASSRQLQRVAIVVAHELAHQWFGNLVTMSWWDDLWLNEGFAAYMEHMCVDALFPEWGVWEQYTTDAMGAALRLDALRSSHPIQVPIVRAEEVEQVFDAISYCKGSTAVRMANCLLGADNFQKGLGLYMSRHAYGNTITTDLWGAWGEVSGIDVPGVMANWTSQMGYPFLKVVHQDWPTGAGQAIITLEQNWFLADGSAPTAEDGDKTWTIPLLFSTHGGSTSAAVLMSSKQQTFTIPVDPNAPSPNFLKINAGQQALVRVLYPNSALPGLAHAIEHKAMPAGDRAAVLLDAYALAKAGYDGASFADVVTLLKAFKSDINFTVWNAISGVLGGLDLMFGNIGGDAKEAFNKFASGMVKQALLEVGWEPKAGVVDGHSTKLLRSIIIGLLDTFCAEDEDVVAEARRRFDEHWENPAALPSDIKTTVYKIVLKAGGAKEYDQILKGFYATTDNAEKKYALSSLGAVKDKVLKLKTLDWTSKSGDVKVQDFFYAIGPCGDGIMGSQLVWDYFKENVEFYRDKLKAASPSLMDAVIINSVNGFATLERATEVEEFFKATPFPSSVRRISQVVESIRNNGHMLNKVKASPLVNASFWA